MSAPPSPRGHLRWLSALLIVGVLSAIAVERGGVGRSDASVLRRQGPCDRPHVGRLVYRWPLRPFDRPHPIRGSFGDPRTVVDEGPLGTDSAHTSGTFSFHNGVDIVARAGSGVFPVVSGTAEIGYGDEVIVETGEGRIFQYFHVRPAVRPGQRVIAYRTMLGRTLPRWGHLHLTEIDGFRVHNPLDPGHLEPYQDSTVPTVGDVNFTTSDGSELDSRAVRGTILISVDVHDATALPVASAWYGVPVAPALVTWRLKNSRGRIVLPTRIVADFRHTEPPRREFWKVYASGTYQNFPAFGDTYFYGRPGRYLFNLTPTPLNTTRFRNGRYELTVTGVDTCGNRTAATTYLRVRN